jgi:hypothetical protein
MRDTRLRLSGFCAAEAAALHIHDLRVSQRLMNDWSEKFVQRIAPKAGEDARPTKLS